VSYISRLVNKLKNLLLDPFDISQDVYHMNSRTAMFQGDLVHSIKRLEQLTKAFCDFEKKMEEMEFYEQVNKALDHSVPDMFWVKDVDGKYVMANEAIREKLLFCKQPHGKTDREIANKIIKEVGAEEHTFGAICGNSDLEVLKHEVPMKFNEDGLVKGEYMMLQVHKNIVRNKKGEIIAVVGVGRDITYEIEVINEVINHTSCNMTKEKLTELLEHYKFDDRD
jgi:PAS domain S-box-containing protein